MNKKRNHVILFSTFILFFLILTFAEWGTFLTDMQSFEFGRGFSRNVYLTVFGWNSYFPLFDIPMYNWLAVASSLLLAFSAMINLMKPAKILKTLCIIFGVYSIVHLLAFLYFVKTATRATVGIGSIATLAITIVAMVFAITSFRLTKNN